MRLRPRQQNAATAAPPSDPLQAVPRVAPNVHARTARGGALHLRMDLPPKGRIGAFVLRHFGWQRHHLMNLDARGAAFWRLINGRRTLETIAGILAKKWKHGEEECRIAVMEYTRTLMTRGLIVLEVTAAEKGGRRK
ncbi:MAG: hypothetical protein PWP23_383 [Candidatus Sumerlaeota bacterium]|nr:hypothetical protein [Candidatus Sumerlaeota bacterium]